MTKTSDHPRVPSWRSLRSRVLGALALAGVVGLLLVGLLLQSHHAGIAERMERRDGEQAVQRLAALLEAERATLLGATGDWATWPQLAESAETLDPAWVEENVGGLAMDQLDIDALLVLAADGHPTLAVADAASTSIAGLDSAPPLFPGSEPLRQAPAAWTRALLASPSIRAALADGGLGVVATELDGRWWLAGVSALQAAPGDRRGSVLFLRALDEVRVARLSRKSQLALRLVPAAAMPSALRLGERHIDVAARLDDPVHGPQLGVAGRAPRELAAPLAEALRQTLLQVGLLLLVVLGLMALLLEFLVLRRLQRLGGGVRALREGRLRELAWRRNGDELEQLAGQFNQLHEALQRSARDWKRAAQRDPLTGLHNRTGLSDRLERALAGGDGRAPTIDVFFLDLDHFKTINDLSGHVAGDLVLSAVAHALRKALPEDVLLARLGGDEFGALAVGRNDAEVLGRAMVEAVASVNHIESLPIRRELGVSIGWVRQSAEGESHPASELLSQADIAMYAAKREGGTAVRRFEPEMLTRLWEKVSLEQRLADAIREEHVQPAFQPIVSAADGRLLRLEVLARWKDAERGSIAPSRFVAIAEATQLAAALDLCVLRQGMAALPAWRRLQPGLQMAFNASPQSLLDPAFLPEVWALLDRHELPADALLLEVTESDVATDEEALVDVIRAARLRGMPVAMDDFGAGQSSLGRLARLRPDVLKLDGSFVRNLDAEGEAVVRAVVGLAHELGAAVTAEWVETPAQSRRLRELGVHALQGYGIAGPLRRAELERWMAARTVGRAPADVGPLSASARG